MAKQNKPKKKNRKKDIRNTIIAKLETALSDFKSEMKEKTFNDALKKGSKLLSRLLFVKKIKDKKKKINPQEVTPENTQ
jgi:hypothetical protein